MGLLFLVPPSDIKLGFPHPALLVVDFPEVHAFHHYLSAGSTRFCWQESILTSFASVVSKYPETQAL